MLKYWIWLAELKVSYHLKRMLLERYGTPKLLYEEDPLQFPALDGLDMDTRLKFREKDLTAANTILEDCDELGITAIPLDDRAYPLRLRNIYDPPFVLYCKGDLPYMDDRAVIAVVGTRKASVYGLDAARRIGYQLGACGGIVVSGMALGIDSAAMEGALLAGNTVIGVLGNGPDVVYPRRSKKIYDGVLSQGCILSEYPPHTQPTTWSFPRRNRIIAGLSCGVVLVESPERSGSLITAEQARDQGRDIFAVPGNIDMPGFVGSNRMLREGAIPVASGWDILSEYAPVYPDTLFCSPKTQPPVPSTPLKKEENSTFSEPKPREGNKKRIDNPSPKPYIDPAGSLPALNETEQKIVEILKDGPALVEEVVVRSGISAGKAVGILTVLEIKKVLKRLPGKRVALSMDING